MRRLTAVFLALPVLGIAAAVQGREPASEAIIPLGQTNWQQPWVPDLAQPGRRLSIPSERRVDVVILSEGYLDGERDLFARDVRAWYDRFLTLTPWSQLRGAFRVRGVWTPSAARVTGERQSHYGVGLVDGKVGNVGSDDTAAAIFAALDSLDVNPARDKNRLTHAVAVMLMKDSQGRNPSGITRSITAPDRQRVVRVGFGAESHHEFGHACGGLRDEYILRADSTATARPPERPSLFTVSNLGYTRDAARLPWSHLAPGSAANPDPNSLIGVLWLGGGSEHGVWHSEARCLMNGRHENWDLAKQRRGENLRDSRRFCFWCEEILVARTWWLTGQLGDGTDREVVWQKWEATRPAYHRWFSVPARVRAQNEANARAGLAAANIYERPEKQR